MNFQYLADHGLYEMIFLAIGIALIGLYSTYLHNRKRSEDEYLLVNTRTGKTESIKISNKIPAKDRQRALNEVIDRLFQ